MSRSVTVCSLLIAAGLAASSVRPASAQGVGTITGRVTDSATGSPLAGASVVIVGTQFGALTDATGRYSIPRVPVGTYSVQAQLIGRNPRTVQGVVIRDGETAVVDFQLEEGAIALDEIVAVGYGTVRRRDLTGSVAQVSSERLEARAVTRIEQALMGQMAGVQVRQTNGQPGAPLEVRVRGAASISASNQPLYVVDGVPVEDLSHVNVDDIASIEVLKDAASAAIYGSRGANGVVLVTTRNGSGAPRFQARTSYGFQVLENEMDLLSAEEWIEIYRELQDSAWVRRGRQLGRDYKASDPVSFRQAELGTQRNSTYIPDPRWEFGTDSLAFIDWQDAFYRRAPIATYQISASGSTDALRYRLSASYLDQEGIAVYTGYDRLNLLANFDVQLSPRARLALNLAPSISWSHGGNVTGKDQQAHQVLAMSPVAERDVGIMTGIKPNDRYYYAGSAVSPVGFMRYSTNETERKQVFSKASLYIDLLPGLNWEATGAWNGSSLANRIYYPTRVQRGTLNIPDGQQSDGRFRTTVSNEYLLQSTITLSRSFGRHNINALVGGSVEYSNQQGSYQRHTRFSDDLLEYLDHTTSTVNNSETTALDRSLVSYLGRIMYSFDGKYLASVSLRRDGSSKFGERNRWGTFPSFSLGWHLSRESFLESLDWLSELKLRFSWGVTGNNQIPDYAAYGSIDTYNYSFGNGLAVGYAPTSISNPDLGWEQTRSTDVGLDLGLFSSRLLLTVDYYDKLTEDLLLQVPVARSTGFSTGWQNIGKVRNRGIEFELTGRPFRGEFQWEPSVNLAFNRNRVVSLGHGDAPIYTGFDGQTAIIKVGEPLLAYYMYEAIGVYMNAEDLANSPRMPTSIVGDVKYRDVNGDGVITADDRTILGHRDPTYVWGFHNTFRYRNFDFSFLFQGQGGNKIYGIIGRAIDRPGMGASTNKLGRWRNRWKSEEEPGDGKTPRIDGTTGSLYDSRWLYDASYVRLRSASIGYTLPAGSLPGIGPARIYLSGENLFLHHHYYGGYSPEADNDVGGDYGGYPVARSVSIGIDFSF